NIQKRIVGGQETEVHQYPWVAMLLYGGRFYCAASLLNDQFLLTASHCVYGFRKERISVRLLEHDRKMSHMQKIDRKVAEVITHPKYNARNYDNDIAIIKLDEPVEFNEVLHPVCMPTPGRSFKGENGIVTGWGALKVGGPTSDTLQEVQVPILSQDECRKSRYGNKITDNMLCGGYDEGGKDSCQGDSGGPLHIVASGTREHQIAGVVSWGEGCAKAGYPGVYARVNRYGTWIKNLTKQACLCQQETKKIKRVSRVLIHPNYSTRNFDSDIALIRFNEPVRLGIDMHPVCLPLASESYAGQTAVVTGWGALSEGGPVSDTLQEVEVPILSQQECRESNYGESKITDNMICAGYVEQGGKDSCQGDSGGPMHVLGSGEAYQLAGIVSWGEGCAKPNAPGVYTRVSNFNQWIEENTRD
ncbi:hypothetical protein KR038_006907, partial [Drosophila bunnanda]